MIYAVITALILIVVIGGAAVITYWIMRAKQSIAQYIKVRP